jgi:hypothetical protein
MAGGDHQLIDRQHLLAQIDGADAPWRGECR